MPDRYRGQITGLVARTSFSIARSLIHLDDEALREISNDIFPHSTYQIFRIKFNIEKKKYISFSRIVIRAQINILANFANENSTFKTFFLGSTRYLYTNGEQYISTGIRFQSLTSDYYAKYSGRIFAKNVQVCGWYQAPTFISRPVDSPFIFTFAQTVLSACYLPLFTKEEPPVDQQIASSHCLNSFLFFFFFSPLFFFPFPSSSPPPKNNPRCVIRESFPSRLNNVKELSYSISSSAEHEASS